MQKRIVMLCLFVMAFLACFCASVSCTNDVSLVIDNKKITSDVSPVILNDRTMVPARVFFEHFDASVKWDGTLRQVIVSFKNDIMIFNIDSPIVYINGITHTLDVSPFIINDRTFLPVRFISEELGYDVSWDPQSLTVYVNSPDKDGTNSENTLPKLSMVEVSEDKENYKISIQLEKNITPKIMTLSDPNRLIFDFYNVNQTCKDGNSKSYRSSIVETRWAYHDGFTRVVVESLEKCEYKTSYSNGKYLINITKPVISGGTQGSETQLPSIEITGDKPLVVLDAGHGGYDPGAVGRDDEGNIILYEKDVCLDIVKRVKTRLEASGIAVILTRSDDVALGDTEMNDLLTRAEIANKANASLFVSVHNNAFSSSTPSGACVLYSGLTSNKDYGITGKEVAQNIQDYIVDATGLVDRGIVPRPNIVVLRETAMPAVLIECAFITNPNDQKILKSNEKRDDIADAICKGIIDSLKTMGKLK